MRKTDLHVGQEVCYQGNCALVLDLGGWVIEGKGSYMPEKWSKKIALAVEIVEGIWIPGAVEPKDIKCTWEKYLQDMHWKSERSAHIDRILAKAKAFGLRNIQNALEEMSDNMLDNFENLLHEGEQFRIIQDNLPLLPRGRSIAFYPECSAPYVMQTPNGDAHLSAPSFVELVQQFPLLFKK